jgi:hypothetical protein
MKKVVFSLGFSLGLVLLSAGALAKIPAPELTDAAKAKAAEAAAKTAWTGKVDAFLLCKSQDRAAANAVKTAKANGKEVKPAKETPPCADPGAFAYVPAAAASAPAATPAAAPAAPAKKS